MEGGQTPPAIAEVEGYDVRTVRKQLNMARQERERGEARLAVLRSALERHHEDLVDFANKLDSALKSRSIETVARLIDDPLCSALREHMPRSVIWRRLSRWDKVSQEMETSARKGAGKLVRKLESRTKNIDGVEVDSAELTGSLSRQLLKWVQSGKIEVETPGIHAAEDDRVQLYYGGRRAVEVSLKGKIDMIKLLKQIIKTGEKLPELKSIQDSWTELGEIGDNICQELEIVRYRRIVSGECRFCPI